MRNKFLAFGIFGIILSLFIGILVIKKLNNNSKEKTSVILGFDPDVPPMGFINQNGEYVGFDLDLAKEVLESQNMSVKYQPIDWDSKEMELNSGNIDCIWNGLSYTPERDKNMLLTKAYMKNRQVVIVKNDSDTSKLDNLKNKNYRYR